MSPAVPSSVRGGKYLRDATMDDWMTSAREGGRARAAGGNARRRNARRRNARVRASGIRNRKWLHTARARCAASHRVVGEFLLNRATELGVAKFRLGRVRERFGLLTAPVQTPGDEDDENETTH